MDRRIAGLPACLSLLWLWPSWTASAQNAPPPNMQVGVPYDNGVLATTNQLLRPSGTRIPLTGKPADLAVSPGGKTIALAIDSRVELYSASGARQRSIALPASVTFGGIAFHSDGDRLAVSHQGGVTILSLGGGASVTISLPNALPCGLAFDPVRPYLYVALNASNRVGRIDLGLQQLVDVTTVGVAPVSIAIAPDGGRLFVADWGGRTPGPADTTSTSAGAPVIVDSRGIAATGAVTVLSLDLFAPEAEIPVGLHPSAVRMSPDGALVAVANSNSDSVSLIDAVTLARHADIAIPAFPRGYTGSSPTAVAFHPDGSRLYVASGGNNSVVTLVPRDGTFAVESEAAVDWYPVALAPVPTATGGALFIANAKGAASRTGAAPFHVKAATGTLTVASLPLQADSPVAALNDPFRSVTARGRRMPADAPDLAALGIRHVFLIIKENRTYDQVLGDLGVGNGAPNLAIYGQRVTPNHHALASGFVTLDNFYATGVVSADGHQWITQAMATDYIERSASAGWPRTYPYSGEDPMAFAPTGFLWDNARRHGLTARIFGEFTQALTAYSASWWDYLADAQAPAMRLAARSRSPLASISGIVDPNFPTFSMNVPDQFRARIFLDAFQQFVSRGNLPNLVLIWLPGDHTAGTAPGSPSPASMVADNDLALGRIVEAISTSPYWPSSAVFVVEDDSQDGVDHVDGHRTVCLVASPYVRRAAVDSTSYNQTSVVRTIEDLLGLPPMNKFDAAALPMRSVFTATPDFAPYRALPNTTSLTIMNADARLLKGRRRSDALASQKMNFSVPDAAPEAALNRILWRAAKGDKIKYPKVPHRPDCRVDDDDDDEMKK